MNVRGAYLEVLGDALGSVAVLVSAAVILTDRLVRRRPGGLAADRRDDRAASGLPAA